MKALVYQGPQQLAYCEVAEPSPAHGHALIRVEAVGICGSDMHAYLGHDERRPAPLILGHEAAGTVVAGALQGKRVTVNPLVTCGTCEDCKAGRTNLCAARQIISMPPREGAFCELISMPQGNLVEIPDGISSEVASLCEPLACGYHGIELAEKALHWPLNQVSALVLGGGAIGVGAALCLSAAGGKDITLFEPNTRRADYLRSKTDFQIVQQIDDRSYHLVIDAYGGGKSRATAFARVRPGGVIVHTGLADNEPGADARRATLQEITFIGTYTYTAEDFRQTARLIFSGKLGALDWFDLRPLADGAKAFSDILAGAVENPKIILRP